MKLYRVRTTAKEYHGCRDVVFQWFRHAMPQGQRPYADLIKDYEPKESDLYTEFLIEELFTQDEACRSYRRCMGHAIESRRCRRLASFAIGARSRGRSFLHRARQDGQAGRRNPIDTRAMGLAWLS